MALTIGIAGLPNVGKSTLFNALTRAEALAANYPFATIEPNVGVVPLPDPRLDVLAGIFASKQIVPASVSFVDIAGIVKGASEGEGLGNKFLANIREADAICQVVRVFVDDDVIHVCGCSGSGRRHRGGADRAHARRPADHREGRQAHREGDQGQEDRAQGARGGTRGAGAARVGHHIVLGCGRGRDRRVAPPRALAHDGEAVHLRLQRRRGRSHRHGPPGRAARARRARPTRCS